MEPDIGHKTAPDAWPADATARLVRAICAAATKDAPLAAVAEHLAAAREKGRAEGLARARRLPMPRHRPDPRRRSGRQVPGVPAGGVAEPVGGHARRERERRPRANTVGRCTPAPPGGQPLSPDTEAPQLRTIVVDGVPVAGDARLVAEIERLRGQLDFARGVVAALGHAAVQAAPVAPTTVRKTSNAAALAALGAGGGR